MGKLTDILVQFLVYRGAAGVSSPRALGPVYSRPEGFPPSASAQSGRDAPLSASSDLTSVITSPILVNHNWKSGF